MYSLGFYNHFNTFWHAINKFVFTVFWYFLALKSYLDYRLNQFSFCCEICVRTSSFYNSLQITIAYKFLGHSRHDIFLFLKYIIMTCNIWQGAEPLYLKMGQGCICQTYYYRSYKFYIKTKLLLYTIRHLL